MPEFGESSFEGSVEHIDLESGSVELRGTTRSGKSYTLTGDVDSVKIVNEREVETFSSWNDYTPHSYLSKSEYWLRFHIKEDETTGGYVYKVQLETVDVERSARIKADDRTAKAIEAARVLAGAPESAKFSFSPRWAGGESLTVDEPHPIEVDFYWTEKVVK